MLALCGLVLMAILLSSPAARASHWKVSVTDSGGSQTTAVITGIPGFDPGQNVTTPWTPPADGNNSTSFNLGSDVLLTAGDASGSCSATVNAKVTLTWVADPASDPAPTQVWIGETAAATAYAIGTGATSQASDGLPGDTYVKDPPGYHLDGGSMVTPSGLPGGGRLTKLTVSNGSVSFNHALSASSSSGESQSDAVDDQDNAYLSYTLTIHPQPYNFRLSPYFDPFGGIHDVGYDSHGQIHFHYIWSSTDGDVSHLTSCVIYEHVSYLGNNSGSYSTNAQGIPIYTPPLPFNYTVPQAYDQPDPNGSNPTPGTQGYQDDFLLLGQPDANGNPPPVNTVIVKPYTTASYTSKQDWKFNDSVTGEVGTELLGPLTITRSVFEDFASTTNPWSYAVSESGYSNTLTLP